ncbi:MAG: PVC-type heme-binding CxxCH protein [Akkermansiaceae bacterium]
MKFVSSIACSLFFAALAHAGDPVNARYVRVELSGGGKQLTLAEVEVMVGKKNVARAGKAKQSSTAHSGDAARAIDGNKNPVYGSGGQTHTGIENKPWWELDLQETQAIDAISIWNRGEGFAKRLDGFSLILLNDQRKEVFKSTGNRAPDAVFDIDFRTGGEISYRSADGKKVKVVTIPADYKDPSPFRFQKEDIISIIGNGLADRMQHAGWTETLLQAALPKHQLSFRNMSLTGDRANQYPRSRGFTPMNEYLQLVQADVVIAMFGYNESFDRKPADYQKDLARLVRDIRRAQPNGESFPRIVLCSPIAHENLNDPNLPSGRANNERLVAITEATRLAAQENGVAFLDLFNPSLELYAAHDEALTLNGIHLNAAGYKAVGEVIASALSGKRVTAFADHEKLRAAVLDKNWHWHNRYRATDGNDVWGGRSGLRFVDGQTNADVLKHELEMIDVTTANRDKRIWAVANGSDLKIDDSNVPPPVPVISNVGGGSRSSNKAKEGSLEYLDGKEAISKMRYPEGFEVNLFADEKKFPQLANPVQMQVDTKGRLWVAAWPTYPKWEPLKEMNDALLILEDTDKDGVADQVKEFAKVHNPVGFEFWNGGVIVSSQPDILFLKDTDGDDVADVRIVLMQGIGSSDTHHAANNLIFGPDGGIYWQSGIFLQHNHETPWGPSLKTGASGMYRFDPRRHTIQFFAGNSPNPHGTSFDKWGYLYANDGTGGRSYQVRPHGKGFKMFPLVNTEMRPVSADAIISSTNFPEEMQQNFVVCNTIGYLGLKSYTLHRDGFPEKNYKVGEVWGTPADELLVSSDGNFRPTDAVFGDDGAMYVSDWHNVIIGHMQHNVRDPNRDKKHGRIYRMVYKDRPLQKSVKIDGQPITALLENFKHPANSVRHRTRVELSARDSIEVTKAAREWVKQLDPQNPEDAVPLLEVLWLHQQHNIRDQKILDFVLNSANPHAQVNAAVVKHHWEVADPALGKQEVEEQQEAEAKKGGILSDTEALTTIQINAVVEKLRFDVKELTVKPGKKIKLIFNNPDFMPHNLLIVKPGTADSVAAAAIALGAEGFKKQFVPEDTNILQATKLLEKDKSEILEFIAPTEPGDYQFVCTFPSHDKAMRGIMRVKK